MGTQHLELASEIIAQDPKERNGADRPSKDACSDDDATEPSCNNMQHDCCIKMLAWMLLEDGRRGGRMTHVTRIKIWEREKEGVRNSRMHMCEEVRDG